MQHEATVRKFRIVQTEGMRQVSNYIKIIYAFCVDHGTEVYRVCKITATTIQLRSNGLAGNWKNQYVQILHLLQNLSIRAAEDSSVA